MEGSTFKTPHIFKCYRDSIFTNCHEFAIWVRDSARCPRLDQGPLKKWTEKLTLNDNQELHILVVLLISCRYITDVSCSDTAPITLDLFSIPYWQYGSVSQSEATNFISDIQSPLSLVTLEPCQLSGGLLLFIIIHPALLESGLSVNTYLILQILSKSI